MLGVLRKPSTAYTQSRLTRQLMGKVQLSQQNQLAAQFLLCDPSNMKALHALKVAVKLRSLAACKANERNKPGACALFRNRGYYISQD